jgi:signal transduction histidine kinase
VGATIVAFSTVLATGDAKQLGRLAGPAFGSGIAWVAGDRTRTRRAYLDQLEERARRAEREREEDARRATEEERNRIARELHDVVAHNVSVIAVQAGAARTTSQGDAARSVETLGLIERTARSTLSELRALLGVLRKNEDAPLLRPQPTLEQLDTLLQHARDAGIAVETRIEGTVRPLPAVVDLCAYRVVQEALTNVIKHAPGAHANVSLRYASNELGITVVDDGPGANGSETTGHGLIGMRERVGMLEGEIHVGNAAHSGFRVEVRLPLQEERE